MRFPFLLLLAACSRGFSSDAALTYGVDPGGSQDVALAREVIEAGGIPAREQFTVEGIYSEHDLPLEGPPCAEILCPRGAAVWTEPVDGGAAGYLLQIGFGTAITAETFARAPLRLVLAVDASGSMEDDLALVKEALRTVVGQLGEADELALVSYDNTAHVDATLTRMDAAGREAMLDTIAGLRSGGSTNMEVGMEVAYDLLSDARGDEGAAERVMLFTDVQPNTGDTSMGSFLGMARENAEAGVGLTVFGIDLDVGSELQDAMAKTEGGNAYFLADEETVAQVLGEEFDFLVTPLAYDLQVDVTPATGHALGEGLGMPLDASLGTSSFGAATLFLSARGGGMGLTLQGPEVAAGAPLASMSLVYRTVEGEDRQQSLDVSWAGGTAYSGAAGQGDDLGVYKMAALTDGWRALLAGAAFCEGSLDQAGATAVVDAAATRLDAVGGELSDDVVGEFAGLIGQLGENVGSGEEACAVADNYRY